MPSEAGRKNSGKLTSSSSPGHCSCNKMLDRSVLFLFTKSTLSHGIILNNFHYLRQPVYFKAENLVLRARSESFGFAEIVNKDRMVGTKAQSKNQKTILNNKLK